MTRTWEWRERRQEKTRQTTNIKPLSLRLLQSRRLLCKFRVTNNSRTSSASNSNSSHPITKPKTVTMRLQALALSLLASTTLATPFRRDTKQAIYALRLSS